MSDNLVLEHLRDIRDASMPCARMCVTLNIG